MKMPGINTSFSRLSDADFETTARHINTSMQGNANFPNPNPSLAIVDAAVTRYSNALVAAKDLGKNSVAEKNESRLALEQVQRLLGLYIMNVSNGSITMLTSSGYPLSKEPGKVYLEAPQNASLTNGVTSGSLVSQVQAVKGGKGYNHQLSTEPPTDATVWQNNLSTTSKYVFTDLLPGKQYWVRVAVSGSRNQLVYSSVVSLFAQ
ncbi:hypothetical protein QWZ08_07250 [Ferruginibacter paludis]|uniref:hypothetical protein n=1 Tax=Ferruginibacter paludis TaxID=1310417 RepID=UPI0025B5D383|nr:hypothetical protein [Ferruginibacter paludis]MDN3655414.1 hypothetical protein [Ferruginibacter paludis]